MNNAIAVAGIHTGIGKTIASAVLAEAMGWDYWKPVQAGLEERDAHTVRDLITNGGARVHPEAVALTAPMSPHAAAAIDGIEIDHTKFTWPVTDKPLLVETAGGLLSPMSETATMADFIQYYKMPVILVVQHYLGSINHTLLTLEVLKSRKIPLLGIVVNGAEHTSSETFIQQYHPMRVLTAIPQFAKPDHESVVTCASAIRQPLSLILQHA